MKKRVKTALKRLSRTSGKIEHPQDYREEIDFALRSGSVLIHSINSNFKHKKI